MNFKEFVQMMISNPETRFGIVKANNKDIPHRFSFELTHKCYRFSFIDIYNTVITSSYHPTANLEDDQDFDFANIGFNNFNINPKTVQRSDFENLLNKFIKYYQWI